MQLKKIYLFASISSQYGVIDHFINELNNAFNRQGVISRIIHTERDNPARFVEELTQDPPDCTLSFNGLLPDVEGRFLSDMLKLPHVAYLTDAPHHYYPLAKSEYTIITCIDKNFCQVFRDFKHPYVLFNPHATCKSLTPPLATPPYNDILLLNSFIDYKAVREKWNQKYSSDLAEAMEEAAEMTLSDAAIPYMQAFIQTLDKSLRAGKTIDPRQIDFEAVFDDLEAYLGGKARVELIGAIEDYPVTVVGADAQGWKKYFPNHANLKCLPQVSFQDALELMKRTKILLNCTPEIKQGLHERILSGLAAGAAVLTLETPFIKEQFADGKNILTYAPRGWDELNQKIGSYLNDEEKRNRLVEAGRELVLQRHTWDQRAQTFIKELPALIEQIKSK
ncbi:MAG: glycosyltransferase [Parachlamydia sp.]|jgi:hypothetical protein|nr:glycosyltransferase [Parachlamydia sp.]